METKHVDLGHMGTIINYSAYGITIITDMLLGKNNKHMGLSFEIVCPKIDRFMIMFPWFEQWPYPFFDTPIGYKVARP